jgi:hypothetical protein
VAEAVRKRTEEIEKAYNPISQLEENASNCGANKKEN